MDTRRNDTTQRAATLKWAGTLIAIGAAIFLVIAFLAFNDGGGY